MIYIDNAREMDYPLSQEGFPSCFSSEQLVNQADNRCDELDDNGNQDQDFGGVVLVTVFLFPAHCSDLLCVVCLRCSLKLVIV